jgi:hypothetical protein
MIQSIHLRGIREAAFICGCGHTGTTLIATMLSCHPQLYVPLRETNVFLGKWRSRVLGLHQLRREALAAGKYYIVEKTPRHINRLHKIRRMIRRPKFIIMVRDGRDVVASIGHRGGGDYEAGMRRWVAETAVSLGEAGKPDVHLQKYEALIMDPQDALREVCAFLGVPYTAQLLEYHAEPRLWMRQQEIRPASGIGTEHRAHRNWQVNQPLFDGRGRWMKDLPDDFVRRFESGRPRDLMNALGYS